jgi:DNA replication protein DnaC
VKPIETLVPDYAFAGLAEEDRARLDAEAKAIEARREAGAREAELDALRKHLIEAGVPVADVERAMGREPLTETPALRFAREAYERRRGRRGESLLLILSGGTGAGKTTAAAWWLARPRTTAVVQAERLLFTTAFELQATDRYGKAAMHQLTRARALVIDELGGETIDAKGHFLALFEHVISKRAAAELPTLFTTNIAPDRFWPRYKERFKSRVAQVGDFYECGDVDLRRGQVELFHEERDARG